MAIYHRKLLPEPDSNQTTVTSDCGPNIPYNNCGYVTIYWSPETPQVPPSSTTNNDTTTHVSPYLIVIVALIASAVLFISYYLISIRYCARLRTPTETTQVNEETRDFMNQDQQPEIDHPIWYINTIGLLPEVINSITVFKFKKGVGLVDGMDCSVCLSEFKDDESLRLLPKCNHAFHIPCIDTWLRSHTNCPLCRAAVVFNNSNTNLQPNYHGFGLNLNTHMENEENDGELLSDDVQECESREHRSEIHESKQEIESVIALRRSLSMDSAADIVLTNSNLSNSTIELQSLNHGGDSRTRRMMMMVRSFSYGGGSIM